MKVRNLTSLVLIFVSIGVWLGADSASLTVGNLLVVRYSTTQTNSLYVPTIVEITPDTGAVVQSWDLSCGFIASKQQVKITFSPDNSKATVICDTLPSENTDRIVYSLDQAGVLSSYTVTALDSTFDELKSAFVDGDDIWITTYQNSLNSWTTYYTTVTTLSSVKLADEFGLFKKFTNIQVLGGNLYQMPDTAGNPIIYYSLADLKATLGTKPKFSDWTGPYNQAQDRTDTFIHSLSEVYFTTSLTSFNYIEKSYYDEGSSSWKNYYSNTVPAQPISSSAQDVNGVRKVYVCTQSSLYVFTDSGSAFGSGTALAPAPANTKYADVTVIPPPPSCNDAKMNQNETDVDCGGVCGATCVDDKKCKVDADCVNDYCDTNTNKCATPTCADSAQNRNETDVDCGGVCGANCADDKKCLVYEDCLNNYCNALNKCATPTCADSAKNQDETDVDCGGTCGANCADGKTCVDKADCSNGFCNMNSKCATPTCSDSETNQDETDVDCGGSCQGCKDDQSCLIDTDCANLYCTASKKCATPTCNDAVKNLNETDVDCGGYCGSSCDVNQSCSVNDDCLTLTCDQNKCIATCSDNLKNQDETDVDCGGNTCSNKCAVQKQCNENSDCQTNYCEVGTCAEIPPVAQPQSTPINSPQSGPVSSTPTSSQVPSTVTSPSSSAPTSNGPRGVVKVSSATKTVIAFLLPMLLTVLLAF